MANNQSVSTERSYMRSHKNKFISFFLDDEEYGVEIRKVKEIIKMMHITPVPNSPFYIKGILNLRGKVIPVFDLRLKFGLEFREYDSETNIIIMDIDTEESKILLGAVVDSVHDIIQFDDGEIETAPAFGVDVDTDSILGIGMFEGKAQILLNIDRILSSEEINMLDKLNMNREQE